MHKVALITGITGQDGAYLAEILLKKVWILAIAIIFNRLYNKIIIFFYDTILIQNIIPLMDKFLLT